jgi:hypothetical protein
VLLSHIAQHYSKGVFFVAKITVEQAIKRARELAQTAPRSVPTPQNTFVTPPKTSGGICDMCGKHAHVRIISKDSQYGICYACKALLQQAYGEQWSKHARTACEHAIKARGAKAEQLLAKRDERRRKKAS